MRCAFDDSAVVAADGDAAVVDAVGAVAGGDDAACGDRRLPVAFDRNTTKLAADIEWAAAATLPY